MKNVLIVDDEKSLLLSIEAGFDAYKDRFRLLTAEDGKKALKILSSETVDLVVTDIRMPQMDGFELLVYMNVHFPAIPVIVMSAYGTREIEGKFESIGIVGFLDKPLDFDVLLSSIEEGLKRSTQHGSMTGISISSFTQLIAMEEKTCLLEVFTRNRKGLFYFHQGELFDAVCGSLTGEEAAIEMMMWDQVQLSFKSLPDKKIIRRINTGLMSLLMESSRRKDENLQDDGTDFSDETSDFTMFTPDIEAPKKTVPPVTPVKPAPPESHKIVDSQRKDAIIPPARSASSSAAGAGITETAAPEKHRPMQQIHNLFKEMASEINGVLMIHLMDADGIVIVDHNLSQLASDAFSAKFGMMTSTVNKALKSLDNAGTLEETIVQTSNIWMVCRPVTPIYYLGLVVNRESTLGNIRLVAGKFLTQIQHLLIS